MTDFSLLRVIAALLLATTSASAMPVTVASTDATALEALRRADLRLAAIGHRLATANVALCRNLAPAPGIVFHALDQYEKSQQDTARAAFAFETPVAVEAVVPDSAADRAGVVANDSISSINGRAISDVAGSGTVATRDKTVDALAEDRPADPIRLTIRRRGREVSILVPASAGCRTLFELQLSGRLSAEADGRIVQIGSEFLERFSDDQIAVVVAHELAHNILEHRRRLDEAGVSRGVFREFGRSGRLFRLVEGEADALSVHLLRNAGYDPADAVRFWNGPGRSIDGGIFRSRTHPSSSQRAQAIASEIASIPSGASRPYVPRILSVRDAPFDR